jgi:hypothetical protein
MHLVRYFGVLAPDAHWRKWIVAQPKPNYEATKLQKEPCTIKHIFFIKVIDFKFNLFYKPRLISVRLCKKQKTQCCLSIIGLFLACFGAETRRNMQEGCPEAQKSIRHSDVCRDRRGNSE